MPRFALLNHTTPPAYHRPAHFDMLLEAGDVCRTWALATMPTAGKAIAGEALADHRPLYLDYEGEVSGGRGEVTRVDSGTFTWLTDEPHEVAIELHGQRLRGRLLLTRVNDERIWSCNYHPQSQ